ncbi:MAG: hypothetical protein ABNH21_08600 [Glaciecola sp.]|jgi:hypothetical protein
MKLSNFAQAAKEIISGGLAALSLFAVLAGQSAHAEDKLAEPIAFERKIATSISTLTVLEEVYLDEKDRLSRIELGYQNNQKSIAEVFEQAIVFHNIEDALVRARAALVKDLLLLKSAKENVITSPETEKARLL